LVKKHIISFSLPLKTIDELRAFAKENKMTLSDTAELAFSLLLQSTQEATSEILEDICPALLKLQILNEETYYCCYNLPKGALKKLPTPKACEACKVIRSLKEAQKSIKVERPKHISATENREDL